jgi:hypothetical protein
MPKDKDLILRELFGVINITGLSEITIKGFEDSEKYHKFMLLLMINIPVIFLTQKEDQRQ